MFTDCFGLLTLLAVFFTGFFTGFLVVDVGSFLTDFFFGGDFFLRVAFVAVASFLGADTAREVLFTAGFSILE